MNFWLTQQKFSYYLLLLVLRWKIPHLILAKHLSFSRNHVFCFQNRKFLGALTQVGFTIFCLIFFFWRFAHLFSLTISTKVCAENFLLFCNWKILKKIEKVLVSKCFMKPGFPIFDYNHRTKQNKKVLVHIFADIENITKRIQKWRKW